MKLLSQIFTLGVKGALTKILSVNKASLKIYDNNSEKYNISEMFKILFRQPLDKTELYKVSKTTTEKLENQQTLSQVN